jgi:hypothetical protein
VSHGTWRTLRLLLPKLTVPLFLRARAGFRLGTYELED